MRLRPALPIILALVILRIRRALLGSSQLDKASDSKVLANRVSAVNRLSLVSGNHKAMERPVDLVLSRHPVSPPMATSRRHPDMVPLPGTAQQVARTKISSLLGLPLPLLVYWV